MSTENLPTTLQEAIIYFSDPDVAFNLMVMLRWPEGVTCPICESREVRFIATRRTWECKTKHPRRQFSVKTNSIFEDSPIKLDKWLCAIWLISNAKNGISSYEVHRALGVTQKTAWFMMHRIRLAMQAGTFKKLSGTVEADETYIGGQARFMHKDRKERVLKGGRGTAGKTIVMGLLERGDKKEKGKKQEKLSKVQATVVQNTDQTTLHKEVRGRVETKSELMTDEHGGYQGLEEDYKHKVINHAESYVQGHVYTNGIENFWTLLKRSIKGTYTSVEPFHLFRYLDEQSFRFNERGETDSERFLKVAANIVGRRVTYAKLTGNEKPLPKPAWQE